MTPSLFSLIVLSMTAAANAAPSLSAEHALFRRQTNSAGLPLNATATIAGRGVSGTFNFLADENEVVTVKFQVNGISGIEVEGENATTQFAYHIHTNPIPSSGDCKGALGHLDPLRLTDALLCDRSQSQYCQEGDLAGKHGKLNNTEVNEGTYPDPYLRFWPQPLSILGRSIVIHLPNSTRIACGNITSLLDGTADANGVATNQSSNYVTAYAQEGSPAPSSSIHLFSSGTIDTALAAQATVPAALPDVNAVPNAVLTTVTLTSSAGGALVTAGFPAVLAASSSFEFSAGPSGAAIFPSQGQSFPAPSGSAGASASASASAAGNNGASTIGISMALVSVGFGAVLALLA